MIVPRLLTLVALIGLASACGVEDALHEETEVRGNLLDDPPALTLLTRAGGVELPAWTYCLQRETGDTSVGGCADGGPPQWPPRLEAEDTAAFTFPASEWAFFAEFRPAAEKQEPVCGPIWRTPLTRSGDRYLIPALGPAGVWDVDVSGHSMTDLGNNMITTFRWVTDTDSNVPVPAWALVDFHTPPVDGVRPGAHGPAVRLEGLEPEPVTAAAVFTVTADSGEVQSFELEPDNDDCAADGLLTFGYAAPADELEVDGDAPFTYQLKVILDGTTYVGTATWPDTMESPGSSGVMMTDWEPPLPESAVRP